jgi:mRNA-degrading endonuclease toxin of MazEF toxin-antitoxin module
MRRGELWEAETPAGRREVVIVSRDSTIALRAEVTVALVGASPREHVAEVELTAADGADEVSAANADVLVTLAKRRLVRRLGALGPRSVERLDEALRVSLGLG